MRLMPDKFLIQLSTELQKKTKNMNRLSASVQLATACTGNNRPIFLHVLDGNKLDLKLVLDQHLCLMCHTANPDDHFHSSVLNGK